MKVVSKLYYDEDTMYLVSDDTVKQGVWFGDNNHVLFSDEELIEEHKKWLKIMEDPNNETSWEANNFEKYMSDVYKGDCNYKLLKTDEYYSEEELNELQEQYPYAVDSYNDTEVINTEDFFNGFEIENYIEYWSGSSLVQREVQILYEGDEIEKIATNLDYYDTHKTGQYDLYKIDGELVLVYSSYYQGDLDFIDETEISAEELKEKFDYDLVEESDQDE